MVETRAQAQRHPSVTSETETPTSETENTIIEQPTPEQTIPNLDLHPCIMLYSKRTKIISSLNRFKNWFDSNRNTCSVSALQVRINDYTKLKTQFDDIQDQIESADLDTPDLEHEFERGHFENEYFNLLTQADELLLDLKERAANRRNNQNIQNSNTPAISHPVAVQLAPINIKPFSGAYTEWLPFFNTFSALVHNDARLNNIQKFHHLKNSLRGDALSAISALPISAENYEAAWSLLQTRFENKRLIVQHHISNLFNLQAVVKDSASSLRQLLDAVNANTQALKSLDIKIDSWDAILIHLITTKLDFLSRKTWEESLVSTELPTLEQLNTHLTNRCHLLEALEVNKNAMRATNLSKIDRVPGHSNFQSKFQAKNSSFLVTNKSSSCYLCRKAHSIYSCPDLLKMNISARETQVDRLRLCKNCLKPSHKVENCKSASCKICHQKHNTLLHKDEPSHSAPQPSSSLSHNCIQKFDQFLNQVLLSTVIINIKDKTGRFQQCRAFLDAGSQSNFILESTCKKLGLSTKQVDASISGIHGSYCKIHQSADITIQSTVGSFSTKINCLVLSKITGNLPPVTFNKNILSIPENIRLGDPDFNISRPVDVLIGAQLFWDLLSIGQIKVSNGPILQKTVLGWIIGGPLQNSYSLNSSNYLQQSANVSLEQQVEKFWSLENAQFHTTTSLTNLEIQCENHFMTNYRRNDDGRFQVRLPFKDDSGKLGNSLDLATKRFFNLERKFAKDNILKTNYSTFMTEYINLNHMQCLGPVDEFNYHNHDHYFLPHHAVFKYDNNETPKIRVVFDGSARTTSGVSLNETLLIGPKIQNDIFHILLRFRTVKFAFTADICKMYRQIEIHPDDRKYQLILWRECPSEPLCVYQLNTVTYGTSCAPFLAIRSLRQLALDHVDNYKQPCQTILDDFYVDDLLTGANTLNEALELRDSITQILQSGQFILSKWASNDPSLVPNTNNSDSIAMNFDNENPESKTLGLLWQTKKDVFKYSLKISSKPTKISKRSILSAVASIYDPLGLLGPITMTVKLVIQNLWSLKLAWDESVPSSVQTQWCEFLERLEAINLLEIPRNIHNNTAIKSELHCFADASEKGYGGTIYLRTKNPDGSFGTFLLCSKNRVAPLKSTTLPRLELCAAVLTVQLCHSVLTALKCDISKKYLWTDSKIVLSWINSSSSSFKTFVANRVAEIQLLSDQAEWRHVPSHLNPSDILSRGTIPQKLIDNQLWWYGPQFLRHDNTYWPEQITNIPASELPEMKKSIVISSNVSTISSQTATKFLEYFSDFNKLRRSLAWLQRFFKHLQYKSGKTNTPVSKQNLTSTELENATITIIKYIQQQEFSEDYRLLTNKQKQVNSNSKLLCLNPYLDKNNLIRVGGRLQNSNLTETQKHPFLLPKSNHITSLIIRHFHRNNLHAGPQATLTTIRQKFWILSGQSAVRKELHKCVKCFRAKPVAQSQLMGNLPSSGGTTSTHPLSIYI